MHSSWQQGIEAWRFHLPTEYQPSPYTADTVFDRTLLRAGETVHMKHFIRAKTLRWIVAGAERKSPGHALDYVLPAAISTTISISSGTILAARRMIGRFRRPPSSAPTTSRCRAARRVAPSPTPSADSGAMGDQSTQELTTGNFRVEEFRIPLMKAAIRVPTQPLVAVTDIPIDLSAEYLSGGAAKGLPVTLRSQINKNASPQFADFDDYVFANGNVTDGNRSQRRIFGRDGGRTESRRASAQGSHARRRRRCAYRHQRHPARVHSGRGARGARISRPQRREPDGFEQRDDLAGEAAGRNPGRGLGVVARRCSRASCGRRRFGQTGRARAGARRYFQPPPIFVSQAANRRILRIREYPGNETRSATCARA